MARKSRGLSDTLAALRRRSRTERSKLDKLFASLSAESKQGEEGQAIKQMQGQIAARERETYLGRNPDKQKRLQATMAANRLENLLGKKGARERLDAQTRRNRITREQIRIEEEGGESAYYGGEAGTGHYERIFYMSTEAFWSGKDVQERDQAIMDALGVKSLKDAYDIVLKNNQEAIARMREVYGTEFTKWKKGDSDPIIAYIENAINFMDERDER